MLETLSLNIFPKSIIKQDNTDIEFGITYKADGWRLVIYAPDTPATPGAADTSNMTASASAPFDGFEGETTAHETGRLFIGPTSPHNAAQLSERFPWLKPRPLGLRTSAGMGDRLGLATPGHIRAVRAVDAAVKNDSAIAPIYAQQSIREMERTGRSAAQVLSDAQWGVFAEGWRDGFGADADHLKLPEHIDRCEAVGYSFYTIDPSAHVDAHADGDSPAILIPRFDVLPWQELEDTPADLRSRYLGHAWTVEDHTIDFNEEILTRAAIKYGRAIAFVLSMYRHLRSLAPDAEMEVSVDETDSPTTPAEHFYWATELRRLGVQWVSLAPRYIGRFEKGIDYIGDLKAFKADFAVHAAIAWHFGSYKLSLHSGSDKFSIYPIVNELTRGLVHLKTAGTSYLEALRTVVGVDPVFFREIYAFALEHYEADKATYHVSADLSKVPDAKAPSHRSLTGLIDQNDTRQILHVTFGSVLTAKDEQGNFRFRDKLMSILRDYPDRYAEDIETHFRKHLMPFAKH